MSGEKILIVDDEQSMCQYLTIMLQKEGYEVVGVLRGVDALREAKARKFDLVITDIKMREMDGIQVLAGLKAIDPELPVIIMTAYASQKSAIDAVNKGAFHYLIKHAKNDEIKMVVRNAIEMRRVRREVPASGRPGVRKESMSDPRMIIGKGPAMQRVFQLVEKVAITDSTILIHGESGTGKELIARAIHFRSTRASGPFVSINCGALPESLLESELFGHVKGSFTGAIKDKEGLFKVATAGTFLLDEIGETTPAIQVKLLRVLQEKEIIPVGGTSPIKIDVRVIAATNRELDEEVEHGRFRADLYYRLNVIPVKLPSLRERREDIPLLVYHFLRKSRPNYADVTQAISKEALQFLVDYDWPGNVRELENIIERSVILQAGEVLQVDDLPEVVRINRRPGASRRLFEGTNVTLEELEREYLVTVLNETGWQKKKASSILGINASTLYRKIQRYGLDKERAREDKEKEHEE
ncbi:MAG TPA: sigma-54 dependent transcriptional regulator [Candidatus Krumholzibacteria bacterium]|nr:sigma-54 dependent transcriptional regulator [Candidatus Krumholzibacteria bacterium]